MLAALWEWGERRAQTQIWPDTDVYDDDVRVAFPDAGSLFGELGRVTPQQALRECPALLLLRADGSLRLSPRFAHEYGPFIALRSPAAASSPFDVLGGCGLALGGELAAEAVREDARYAQMLDASGRALLAVPSMDDVLAARQIGIAAIPWHGLVVEKLECLRDLERLTGGGRRWPLADGAAFQLTDEGDTEPGAGSTAWGSGSSASLGALELSTAGRTESASLPAPPLAAGSLGEPPGAQEAVNLCDPADDREIPASAPEPIELILAAWSFSRRDAIPVEQLRSMTSLLAQAQECLGLDLSGIGVWIPRQREVKRLEFCWGLEDRDTVFSAIVDLLGNSTYIVFPEVDRQIGPRRGPRDFVEARAALLVALQSHGKGSEEVRRSLHEYFGCFEREYGARLMREAASRGVARRALMIEFAEQFRVFLTVSASLQQDLAYGLYEAEAGENRALINNQGKFFLQVADRVFKHGRELCK